MKIKNYELFKVPSRWLFFKIETDEGLVGWGEPGKIQRIKEST